MSKTLTQFLINHRTREKDNITHTRIGNGKGILPGKYCIMNDDLDEFYKLYHQHVFIDGKNEYLTEKQRKCNNPLLIDLDFRYETNIKERQHTKDHINELIALYCDIISRHMYHINENENFQVFVFEKPNVNCLDDKTKDGIHIVFNINMSHHQQLFLRTKMLENIGIVLGDIPITNDYSDILDIGISRGSCNWQLYGSRKPENERYSLIMAQNIKFENEINDGHGYFCYDYIMTDIDIDEYDDLWILKNTCARNTELKTFNNTTPYMIEYIDTYIIKPKHNPIENQYEGEVDGNLSLDFDYTFIENSLNKASMSDLDSVTWCVGTIKRFAPTKDKKILDILNKVMSKSTKYNDDTEWVNTIWNMHCIDYEASYLETIRKFIITPEMKKEMEEKNSDYISEMRKEGLEKMKKIRDLSFNSDDLSNNIIVSCENPQTDMMEDLTLTPEETRLVSGSGAENDVARVFYNHFGKNFLFRKGLLYNYTGVYWKESDGIASCLTRLLSGKLHNLFKIKAETMFYSTALIKDHDEMEKLRKKSSVITDVATDLKKTHYKANVKREILEFIANDEVEFETKTNLFAFNNKIYNLDTDTWVKPKQTDYVTLTTGYDYEPSKQEDIDYVKSIIEKILPEEDVRKFYMVLVATGMYGITLQKFIVARGCGRNGKGMLNDFIMCMMGNYGYELNSSVLLKPVDDGVNQQIANMNNKRFVITREPCGAPLNNATIRQITGGATISARGAYDKDTKKHLRQTLIMETNDKLDFKSKIEQADVARFDNVPFDSRFTDDEALINPEEHVYEMDTFLGTDEFREKYRLALFEVMLEYNREYKKVNKNIKKLEPKVVKMLSREYLINGDKILKWCDERMKKLTPEEMKGETPFVKMTDIFTLFKNSEFYMLLTKKEKRDWGNKKGLTDYLKNSLSYQNSYFDRKKINNLTCRNIIYGFKMVKPDFDEEDDDDNMSVDVENIEDEEC